MEKHKILIVIGQLEIGGTEKQLSYVLPRIAGSEFQIVVFSFTPGGHIREILCSNGIEVISPPVNSNNVINGARAVVSLVREMIRQKPAALHFILPKAYLVAGLVTYFFRCKKVLSRRSLNHYQQRRIFARPIEKFLHRRLDLALANSSAIAKQLFEEGVDKNKIAVVYNGVDLEKYTASEALRNTQRSKLDLSPETCCIIIVANLIEYKGHRTLFEALGRLGAATSKSWRLLVVGADNGNLRSVLQQQTKELGIDENIRWMGQVADVQPLLAASDIGVSASYEEGFSNAILEYMAAGLPVVATTVGGSPEVVMEGRTGLLVAPRNDEALCDALQKLAGSESLRMSLGKQARQHVFENFSIEKCANEHASVYRSLLS